MKISAFNLIPGVAFRLRPNSDAWRVVRKVRHVADEEASTLEVLTIYEELLVSGDIIRQEMVQELKLDFEQNVFVIGLDANFGQDDAVDLVQIGAV